MKKLILFSIIGVLILFSSCASKKTIDGKTYRPYGFFNEDLYKNDSIQYSISGWAVASGIIFSETIIVPIYTFGYHLWEPIQKKSKSQTLKGVVTYDVMLEMKTPLLEHGFKESKLLNEFTKGKEFNAIIWNNGNVTISRYTLTDGKFLGDTTFQNKTALNIYLENI